MRKKLAFKQRLSPVLYTIRDLLHALHINKWSSYVEFFGFAVFPYSQIICHLSLVPFLNFIFMFAMSCSCAENPEQSTTETLLTSPSALAEGGLTDAH